MLTEIKTGHWYLPREEHAEAIYDCAYIAKYEGYAKTDMGKAINAERQQFVNALFDKDVKTVDVGVGSGDFMYVKNCLGYDVNPLMVKQLTDEGRFVDVYNKEELEQEDIKLLTFFDSFEHIQDPSMILRNMPEGSGVIMSIPIYRGFTPLEEWKHYRPNEHLHYFTNKGLMHYMKDNGYMISQFSEFESNLGREDIFTYCFIKGM